MSYIYVEENDLTWAAQQGLVTPNEATALWPALVKRTQGRGNLNLAQVAFYAGSLLIIGALSWFMTVVWASSEFLFFLALAYSAVFGAGGVKLWFDGQAQYGIPQAVGGLFVTIAVAVAPIATFAAQRYFNEWPISDGILIELTLVAGGALAFYFIRFPFLTAPIAAGLYGMSAFDLSQAIWHHPSVAQICLLSFAFGLAMDAVAFGIDRQRFQQDYGFWLYLFGTASSFGALTWLFGIGSNLLGPYNCGYAIFSALCIVRPSPIFDFKDLIQSCPASLNDWPGLSVSHRWLERWRTARAWSCSVLWARPPTCSGSRTTCSTTRGRTPSS